MEPTASPLRRSAALRGSQRGATLLELIIVVVVIAILATVAIVSYTAVVNRTTVSQGQSVLDGVSQSENNWYSLHGAFAADASSLNAMDAAYFPPASSSPPAQPITSTGLSSVSVTTATSGGGYAEVIIAVLDSTTNQCLTETVTEPDAGLANHSTSFTASMATPCAA